MAAQGTNQGAERTERAWLEFWIPWAVFSLLGGINVLTLAEAVWVDLDFSLALERLLAANAQFLEWVAGPFEPLAQALVGWLNERFGWSLTLYDHWRPLAALALIMVLAMVRGYWRRGNLVRAGLFLVLTGGFSVLGALLAGLAPLGAEAGQAAWQARAAAHALAAGAPLSLMLFGAFLAAFLGNLLIERTPLSAAFGKLKSAQMVLAVFGGIAAALAAALASVPVAALQDGAGFIVLAGFVALIGVLTAWLGSGTDGNKVYLRVGLSILGGFGVAALIWGADLAARAMGG